MLFAISSIHQVKPEFGCGNGQIGAKSSICYDASELGIRWMTVFYTKTLVLKFHSYLWNRTQAMMQKISERDKFITLFQCM